MLLSTSTKDAKLNWLIHLSIIGIFDYTNLLELQCVQSVKPTAFLLF